MGFAIKSDKGPICLLNLSYGRARYDSNLGTDAPACPFRGNRNSSTEQQFYQRAIVAFAASMKAHAIERAPRAETTPLRLQLGAERMLTDLAAWEQVAVDARIDSATA